MKSSFSTITSVDYFNYFGLKIALKNGITPFYWATGGMINRTRGATTHASLPKTS
ncbi:MAG: hypothetical protein RJQ14_22535 [Marinoscillum sp.]